MILAIDYKVSNIFFDEYHDNQGHYIQVGSIFHGLAYRLLTDNF